MHMGRCDASVIGFWMKQIYQKISLFSSRFYFIINILWKHEFQNSHNTVFAILWYCVISHHKHIPYPYYYTLWGEGAVFSEHAVCHEAMLSAVRKFCKRQDFSKSIVPKALDHTAGFGTTENNNLLYITGWQFAILCSCRVAKLKLILLNASSIPHMQWSCNLSNIEWTVIDSAGCSHKCLCLSLLSFDVDVITQPNQ